MGSNKLPELGIYARLDSELVSLGFSKCKVEHAVYRKGDGESLLVVGVYVDDLIICGPSVSKIAEFKQQMMQRFNMSDLGLLSYYLGMEVRQDENHITICQRSYAAKIVEQCQMTGCNPIHQWNSESSSPLQRKELKEM